MLKKLRAEVEVDVSADLGVVYNTAYRAKENAFPLCDVGGGDNELAALQAQMAALEGGSSALANV
jgi:hypothetical protein